MEEGEGGADDVAVYCVSYPTLPLLLLLVMAVHTGGVQPPPWPPPASEARAAGGSYTANEWNEGTGIGDADVCEASMLLPLLDRTAVMAHRAVKDDAHGEDSGVVVWNDRSDV